MIQPYHLIMAVDYVTIISDGIYGPLEYNTTGTKSTVTSGRLYANLGVRLLPQNWCCPQLRSNSLRGQFIQPPYLMANLGAFIHRSVVTGIHDL